LGSQVKTQIREFIYQLDIIIPKSEGASWGSSMIKYHAFGLGGVNLKTIPIAVLFEGINCRLEIGRSLGDDGQVVGEHQVVDVDSIDEYSEMR